LLLILGFLARFGREPIAQNLNNRSNLAGVRGSRRRNASDFS
jgi:hypothetical protein